MRTRRSSDVLVSTTDELEGWEVTEYLDVVSAHVVAGTGFFSDVAASFSDVFGGRSGSYKKQLESINEEATRELKEKAAQQGADALLGLRIDHDEISGQQKGMLMVTATGTAVRARQTSEPEQEESATSVGEGPVSVEELEVEARTRRILKQEKEGNLTIDKNTWRFLIEHRVSELARPIRVMIVEILQEGAKSEGQKIALERGKDYFLTIGQEIAKKHLYKMLRNRSSSNETEDDRLVLSWALDVLEEGQMLDFQWVRALLDEDDFLARKRALEVLAHVDKPYYTKSDIGELRKLEERISSEFEKRGEVLEVEESGMLSSETKEVWQIEEGIHNEMHREYCKETGKNIYGFTREETKPEEASRAIRQKIEALESLQQNTPE